MEDPIEIQVFKCIACPFKGRCFGRMLRHYSATHEHEAGFKLTCGIDACQNVFTNVRSFKRHLKAKHGHFYETHITKSDQGAILIAHDFQEDTGLADHPDEDINMINDDVHEDAIACPNHPLETQTDLRRLTALQMLRLREERKLTYVSCTHALEVMANVVSAKDDLLQDHVRSICQSTNINADVSHALQEAMDQNMQEFQSVVDEFSDERRLNKYVQENFAFVEPQEHIVGGDTKNTMQYVPILETLQLLLKHDDIFAQVVTSHQSQDNVLRDVCDGQYFRTNPLFSTDPTALQIMLYFDEFTSVNPIGHAAKDFKFGGFYFLLGNLEPEYRSKLHVIQLALLASSKTIKDHGFSSILVPLLRDLKVLENEGIEVQKADGKYQFKGSISVVVADNLGSHGIGGFQESFNALRNCRFCMVTREQLRVSHSVDNFERRTVTSYTEQLQQVAEFQNFAGIYGLKRPSRLNELQFFHVVKGLPSDVAHDLFEGVVCDVLVCIITHFVHARVFSLVDLEQRMNDFTYKATDKVNKPRPLATQLAQLKIKQKAVQTWCLLRLFPLLVGDFIAEGDPKWEVLLALCDVVDVVTAPTISRAEALLLYDLLERFHTLLGNEFPDLTVKPKGQFILHYPQQILDFGPLIACWTLRFEGKHSFFKETANRLKCRKNVCKTLAYRHQYHQALCHESTNFLTDDAVSHMTNTHTLQVGLLLEDVQELLRPLVSKGEDVCQCSSIRVNGADYRSGCGVVVGFDNDEYEFAKMESCFMIGGIPYLLCKGLRTLMLNRHSHCYVVEQVSTYSLIKPRKLLDYHPLPIYSIGDEDVIVLHHKVSCNF